MVSKLIPFVSGFNLNKSDSILVNSPVEAGFALLVIDLSSLSLM